MLPWKAGDGDRAMLGAPPIGTPGSTGPLGRLVRAEAAGEQDPRDPLAPGPALR
jgi:hypothetical protein